MSTRVGIDLCIDEKKEEEGERIRRRRKKKANSFWSEKEGVAFLQI